MIKISINDNDITGKLNNLANRQMAFALSLGLNKMTAQIRDRDLEKSYSMAFEKRNKQFFKLVHTISNSDRKQWRNNGLLMSAIQQRSDTPPMGAKRGAVEKKGANADTSFMIKHVTGGDRYPKRRYKFVPISGAPIRRKRSGAKAGSVVESVSPSTLYPTGSGKTFINSPRGTPILFRRIGRGKKQKPQAMYHLQSVISNSKKYSPLQTVKTAVARRSRKAFTDAIIHALRTAKLRS